MQQTIGAETSEAYVCTLHLGCTSTTTSLPKAPETMIAAATMAVPPLCQCACQSASPSVSLSVRPSVGPSVCPQPICQCTCRPIRQSTCLSVSACISQSWCSSVCLSVSQSCSVHLSASLLVFPSISRSVLQCVLFFCSCSFCPLLAAGSRARGSNLRE